VDASSRSSSVVACSPAESLNEYALAKYDRAGVVRLRDVLFLCHAKPNDADQAGLWRRLIEGTPMSSRTTVSLPRTDAATWST
jgi:60 kDa SS-A/Ro ribonucleoprotein